MPHATILAEPYAGLQAQAVGLAEAAGLDAVIVPIEARAPWKWVSARAWPWPLRAVPLPALADGPVLAAGGTAAAVAAALRGARRPVVQVQHPRMDPARFDVVVVNRHDGLTGPNVVVTRTALHRVTPGPAGGGGGGVGATVRASAPAAGGGAGGGSNGRFRLDGAVAAELGGQLAGMMRADQVGVMVTPSRRTSGEARAALRAAVEPLGGWVWDMAGENPYFGMLAVADAIVVTEDSVSMVSEAVATHAPVLLAGLPGRSRRIRLFTELLVGDGRVRPFGGRLELWGVAPLDDTAMAGEEVRRRLGL